MDSIISAKGFTKKYSKFTLDVPELDIPKGFATALIGANGAGKTTLIDALCGIIHATSGEVTYFGKYKDIDSPELREKIGYCASSGFFPQAWRAKDIAISMEIAYDSFDRKNLKSCAGRWRWIPSSPKKRVPCISNPTETV